MLYLMWLNSSHSRSDVEVIKNEVDKVIERKIGGESLWSEEVFLKGVKCERRNITYIIIIGDYDRAIEMGLPKMGDRCECLWIQMKKATQNKNFITSPKKCRLVLWNDDQNQDHNHDHDTTQKQESQRHNSLQQGNYLEIRKEKNQSAEYIAESILASYYYLKHYTFVNCLRKMYVGLLVGLLLVLFGLLSTRLFWLLIGGLCLIYSVIFYYYCRPGE